MNIEFGSAELNRFLDWALKNVKLDPDGRGYWLYYISDSFERSLGAKPCSAKDLVEVFRKSEHESARYPSVNTSTSENIVRLHKSIWSKRFKKILAIKC